MTQFLRGAVALMTLMAGPALAEIRIHDGYARAASPSAKAGAAFFVIENTGPAEDRLIAVTSDIAKRSALHSHEDMGNGVMRMVHVEEGFVIPAQGRHALARGGDHVMLMGLTRPMIEGGSVTLTLTFEQAGAQVVTLPVDLGARPEAGAGHGGMDHGTGH